MNVPVPKAVPDESIQNRFQNLSGREAYRARLSMLAKTNARIFCLDSDMGGLETGFGAEFPDRYANVGIAEANLISVAAGMAKVGWIPFANTMATFAAARACEQIKLDVALTGLPVKIAGSHAGVSAGHLGPTHHALEDIALMRAMPGLAIIVPSDAIMTDQATAMMAEHPGPVYMRLGRNATPLHHAAEYEFRLGRADTLREGGDLALLSNGPSALGIALDAADALSQMGIEARVLDVHTIKPLDEDAVLAAAKESGRIITIEEHSILGGLGSAVAETVLENGVLCRLQRIGARDRFADTVGDEAYLLGQLNISAKSVLSAAAMLLNDPALAISKEDA